MDDKQKGQACLAALLLLPTALWFITAKAVFGIQPETARAQVAFLLSNTFELWQLKTAFIAGLVLAVVVCGLIIKFGSMTFRGASFDKYYRGSQLISQLELKFKTRERNAQITIADVPVPIKAETTHFAIGGATGTGKTTIFKEMMCSAIKRGDKLAILDPDGEFLSTFYKPGDKILNPFDIRTEGWSFFNEIREDFDFERIAKSIIQKSESSDSEEWNQYGRLLFHEVARKVFYNSRNPSMREVFSWTNQRDMDDLEKFVKGTNAQAIFTGNERASSSVRFVLSNKIPSHLKMPPGNFSIRKWLETPNDGNLFITWNESQKDALKPLISCWVDTIYSSVLGMSSDRNRRIWTFLDELESLDHLATLNDALTKGRKKGLCVATGFQSYAQVEHVYGDKKAETILGNHRSLLALAVGRMGTSTAKKMSEALGEHEIKRMKEGSSQRWGQMGTRSENEDVKPERIVMPAEISNLPDLEGFLSFPGSTPIARVKFEAVNYIRKEPVPGIIQADMKADFVC